jgi:hypothetical protein
MISVWLDLPVIGIFACLAILYGSTATFIAWLVFQSRMRARIQGLGQFAVIQAVAASFRVELRTIDGRDADEIERVVAEFARSANGDLIVTASGLAIVHRQLILALAARHKLPTIYFQRFFVDAGGLDLLRG